MSILKNSKKYMEDKRDQKFISPKKGDFVISAYDLLYHKGDLLEKQPYNDGFSDNKDGNNLVPKEL